MSMEEERVKVNHLLEQEGYTVSEGFDNGFKITKKCEKKLSKQTWREHLKAFPRENEGDLTEWLKRCPASFREEILTLMEDVTLHCYTCWWFQFSDVNSNRACKYGTFDGDSEMIDCDKCGKNHYRGFLHPNKSDNGCDGWRLDPWARRRASGLHGVVE